MHVWTLQEMLGNKNVDHIREFTIAKALKQEECKSFLSKEELEAFFGQCFFRGVLKGSDKLITNFWYKEYGRRVFVETMARNKCQSILCYIFFDGKTSRQVRQQSNKFTAIRELWNAVMNNF